MLKKRLLCLLLCACLLSGAGSALAAGTSSDPLVSLSYAKSWAEALLSHGLASIDSLLVPFYETAKANALASVAAGIGSTNCALNAGGTLSLGTGASVMLLSGSASVRISQGAVVNISLGTEAGNGKLNPMHRYIACENTSLVITADSVASFLVDGSFTKSDVAPAFTDVRSGDWFYNDVYSAVASGIIEGMTATTFEPGSKLSLAQTLTLAARMHQLYNEGEVTLQNGSPWYQTYLDYAIENGIVDLGFAERTEAEFNAAITRRDYVSIFYRALPESEYRQINSIAAGAIPDLPSNANGATAVYSFYRAGILTGSGTTGQLYYFLPDTDIIRGEVAAVITRMLDATARKTFTIS